MAVLLMKENEQNVMRFIIPFIITLFLLACTQYTPANFGAAASFFPPSQILEVGIVNKYYVTRYEDKQDPSTEIQYRAYELLKDTLFVKNYNAGYELKTVKKYLFIDNIMTMIAGFAFDGRNNKSDFEILDGNFLVWNNEFKENLFHYKQNSKYFNRETALTQDLVEDTTYFGLKTKKFTNDYKVIITSEEDSSIYKGQDIRFYAEGKGNVYFRSKADNYLIEGELVEQIPMERFIQQKNHGHHRIAYIDPETSLLTQESFSPCDENPAEYFDYYNGTPAAHFKGKKGGLWALLHEYIKPELLEGESGYLSVRFLVNCQGETGYFTTEMSDLDYQEYTFPESLTQHLVAFTSSLKSWQATHIQGEARDSYAYIIYKIVDGKITEILP